MMVCIFSLVGSICFPFSFAHCLCLPNFHPFFFSSPKSSRVFFQFGALKCEQPRCIVSLARKRTHIQSKRKTKHFCLLSNVNGKRERFLTRCSRSSKNMLLLDRWKWNWKRILRMGSFVSIVIFLGWASFKSILDGLRAQILAQNCIFIASARIDGT